MPARDRAKPERSKVRGADCAHHRGDLDSLGASRGRRKRKSAKSACRHERQGVAETDFRNASHGPQSLAHRVKEVRAFAERRRTREGNARREDVVRVVAAIDRQQRQEAAAEETSAREQRTGDGDLRAHQQSAEPGAAGTGPSLAAAAVLGE